jgi:MFS transporter, PPP family, 3-phenylpropionic acid transporter
MIDTAGDVSAAASLARRMSFFYGAAFFVTGIYFPYFPIWLANQGYSPALAAVILSIPMFARIVATPLVTFLADKSGNHRALVLVLLVLSIAGFAAPLALPGFAGLALLTLANALAFPAVIPLAETFALAGVHRFGLDYGRMRMWGSIMFMVANIAGGVALLRLGSESFLPMLLVGMALVLAVSLFLPGSSESGEPVARVSLADMGVLLATPRYALLLLTASVIQGSHGVLNAFASLTWQARGIPEDVIGLLWATGVVSEVLLMAFARHGLARCGAAGLIAIGAGAALLRWIGLGFDPPLVVLFVLQALHGLTFGATHIGAMNDLARSVPQRLSGTAQGLYAAATAGIASGSMVLLSGPLYAHFGAQSYWVMALIAAVGLALALRFQRMGPA